MLAEFLAKVVDLAREKTIPHKLDTGSRNASTYLIDGKQQTFLHDPPKRAARLVGVADLVLALTDPVIAPAPEVYHSEAVVTALLNRDRREDSVSLSLPLTETFGHLMALSHKGTKLSPKDMIKFLRNSFGLVCPEHVVSALRRIDFTRTSAGKSHVEHGKESLGRSVEAAVQQADQVPEGFVVRTRVYSTPGVHHVAEVKLSLYLDLDDQAVEIRVLPDELVAAMQGAQAVLHETLVRLLEEREGQTVPVFYGTP